MTGPDYDYRDIDDVIHGRLRLAVMAYLSGSGEADFNELKAKIGGTDGNLSVQIRKLEEAGYIAIKKSFAGRKPQTRMRLTKKGRDAWIAYIARMEALLRPAAAE